MELQGLFIIYHLGEGVEEYVFLTEIEWHNRYLGSGKKLLLGGGGKKWPMKNITNQGKGEDENKLGFQRKVC